MKIAVFNDHRVGVVSAAALVGSLLGPASAADDDTVVPLRKSD